MFILLNYLHQIMTYTQQRSFRRTLWIMY